MSFIEMVAFLLYYVRKHYLAFIPGQGKLESPILFWLYVFMIMYVLYKFENRNLYNNK